MKVHEFLTKDLLEAKSIPVPRRMVVRSPEEAFRAARELGGEVVVKAQVLVAGRGKAGGIKMAKDELEARSRAEELLRSSIKGVPVKALLVEEKVDVARELYLGFTVDRSQRKAILLASSEGGVDLEELARERPQAIYKRSIDPFLGLRSYEARYAAEAIGLQGVTAASFVTLCERFYSLFREYDCELVETNPLALTKEGRLVALDARMIIDDNAAFKHTEFQVSEEELTPLEAEAKREGFSFVELEGEVGIIGNGAGLVMATLDMVAHYGARPANFLDVGGGARADVVKGAVRLVLKQPKLRVVLINILGGITRCDEVAKGLLEALKESPSKVPLVVRLVGTNEEEGKRILKEGGVSCLDGLEEAAQRAAEMARGG